MGNPALPGMFGNDPDGLTRMSVTSQCLQKRFRGLALLGESGSTITRTYFLCCERAEGDTVGTGVTARSPKIPLFPLFPSRCALRVGSPQRGARNGWQGRPQTRSGMIESQIFPEEKCGFCLLQRKGTKEDSLCFQPSSHHIPPWPITGFLGSRGD